MKLICSIIIFLITKTIYAQDTKYYMIFDRDRKFGIADSSGKVLLTPAYTFLGFNDNLIRAEKGKFGVLDARFNVIIPFEYDNLWMENSKYKRITVQKNKKMGVLSYSNKIIIPPIYDHIYFLGQGFISFKKDGYFGVMDSTGKITVPPKYGAFSLAFYSKNKELRFVVYKNKECGFMDKTGRLLLKPSFNYVSEFDGAYAIFHVNGKYGIVDRSGNININSYYDRISLEGNIYIIEKNGKFGAFDKKSLKPVLELNYDKIQVYRSETGFVIMKNHKYGFVDLNGKILIDMIYDGANNFSKGLAPVLKNGKWGIINPKNQVVVDFKFIGNVKPFINGYALFYPLEHSTAEHSWNNSNDPVGLIDINGNIVIDAIYDNINYFFGNKASVLSGKFTYLFDLKTKEKIMRLRDLDVSL